ncbi:Alpha-glucosidase, glycosyl hydrolase family GH31 [Arachidicoccus rhizosphaerae]|uniref:Alpha-glucosidase, glycosyl hydrolase family GH31 n=1 Tax=Arachidicoccus rhizosphaerae TaxID=551991 RepID=A0A1H3YF81_9BACT|nr:TIM-barrel domain-containing protein [Arachidicoccus rhizosphaerae]SEA09578.1 Alpha-glucosidase, glycosyl hydrolase family GH31 [Arachidicoccus rhizosphaerae]
MKRRPQHLFLSKLLLSCLITGGSWQIATATVNVPSIYEKADSIANQIKTVEQINPTTVQLIFTDNRRLTVDFYGQNIFRVFEDMEGGIIHDPEAKPAAQILVDQPRKDPGKLMVKDLGSSIELSTELISLTFNKSNSIFTVTSKKTGKTVLQTLHPIEFTKGKVSLDVKENPDEYYYGGGVQNGRFSHKGRRISIENQNSWTDGGVASPTPFYWSTEGYGVLFYTFAQGVYDFGAKTPGIVHLSHNSDYFDAFFMIDDGATKLLQDFYQLTGNPVLLPKFAFYEGHLNAYNRDFWKEDPKGILFEDGKRYKESQKDNGGIKESLNGEKGNYQFSARAVIDRYQKNDLPLGWLLPNDGYGAGYGQTSTLDSNIANLKSLGDYARKKGVEIGLWTQSDLHPKAGISALLQRDIVKEVRDAGVRVLKTDVAWVGAGYSFGLHGVADVGHIVPYYGHDARPFIISLDGWAGTQRYAGVWSGDQTGGNWEYIRFHIPTFIGAGLSGQPNITSDMDGIFGGKNPVVNARGFEWKTFTPMQLNMDGWGSNEKYPQAMGEPTTSINRTYLKLKSELIPYTYSIAHQAVSELPMVRAMFLEYPNDYTKGSRTQYQFMYGPNFLVAPIYQDTKSDALGNDIRNNIYLPKGQWVDYFTGDIYTGDVVLNSFDAPIWKLPVFVKRGAIIPMANPNNNVHEINTALRIFDVYPYGNSSFTAYEDDGTTEAYKAGQGATTVIKSEQSADRAMISVLPTRGDFDGFVKDKATLFRVNLTRAPKSVVLKEGKSKVKLTEVKTLSDFNKGSNVYFYNSAPDLNQFATKGSSFEQVKMIKNPELLVKTAKSDITTTTLLLEITGYQFESVNKALQKTGSLEPPTGLKVLDSNKTAYSLGLSWDALSNADYYEIEFNQMLYTHIKTTQFLFDQLIPETNYNFKVRGVNKTGASSWASLTEKTGKNPLEFAIHNISAVASAAPQEGMGVDKMFDFAEGDDWHTDYEAKAVPFDVIIDLNSVNELDKLQYLPRISGRNGIITKVRIYYSQDKNNWTEAGEVSWNRDNKTKEYSFGSHPAARYIKLSVEAAVGDFGSGRELYIFKVPGSESYLPGDINNDHKIDHNDLTSYMNYTGLRKGDGDFEGYISKGDINKNDLIDAYDISVVATQLEGGIKASDQPKDLNGTLAITADKQSLQKGDVVNIQVKGVDLKNVNALSFAIPYNAEDFDYIGVQPLHMASMENLTYDRLHTDGSKVLYPTFINVGEKPTLNGSETLFTIRLKAKRAVKLNLSTEHLMIVGSDLSVQALKGSKIQ